MATRSFYEQVSANKRNSLLMAAFVVAVLGLLGFAIGYALVGSPAGGVGATGIALAVGSISGLASWYGGDIFRASKELHDLVSLLQAHARIVFRSAHDTRSRPPA